MREKIGGSIPDTGVRYPGGDSSLDLTNNNKKENYLSNLEGERIEEHKGDSWGIYEYRWEDSSCE